MAYNDMASAMGTITKIVYSNNIADVYPNDQKVFFEDIPFNKQDTIGLKFSQWVNLGMGGGLVTGATGPLTYPDPYADEAAQAEVAGYQIGNNTWLDYQLASSARSQGKQAFADVVGRSVLNLIRRHRWRMLMNMLYGKLELGIVNADTTNSPSVVVSLASWAPGIWNFQQNIEVDIYSANLSTKRNATAPLKLDSYDLDTRTLTFTGADAAGLDCTATDRIVPVGVVSSSTNNESYGIHAILATASAPTTLFGINQSNFSVFLPNTYSLAGDDLDQAHLDKASNKLGQRGYRGKMKLYCSQGGYSNLNREAVTRVKMEGGQVRGKSDVGYRQITLETANGDVEVIGSPYVKEGIAFLVGENVFSRVGSCDIVEGDPRNLTDFWKQKDGVTALEARTYSNVACFTAMPAHAALLTNIVNT